MTIDTGDFLGVTAVTFFEDQLGENNFYFRVFSAVGVVNEQDLADELAQVWQNPYNGAMTNLASFKGTVLKNYKDLEQEFAPVGYYGRPKLPGSGQFGTTPMARQVSGLITVQSLRGGKGGKGRRYIPFPDADANEAGGNGSPTIAYRNCLTQIVAACLSPITISLGASSVQLGPLHQTYVKPVPPIDGYYDYYAIIPSRTIYHDAWATQRRRGSFGRVNADPFL